MEYEQLEELLKNNSSVADISKEDIERHKTDVFNQLGLDKDKLNDLGKKLKKYRYIDEINEINPGGYIRWINVKNPEVLNLTNGGIVCETKVTEHGMNVVCKNNYNRFMELKMNECVIFQKLNNDEKLLMSVMKYMRDNQD